MCMIWSRIRRHRAVSSEAKARTWENNNARTAPSEFLVITDESGRALSVEKSEIQFTHVNAALTSIVQYFMSFVTLKWSVPNSNLASIAGVKPGSLLSVPLLMSCQVKCSLMTAPSSSYDNMKENWYLTHRNEELAAAVDVSWQWLAGVTTWNRTYISVPMATGGLKDNCADKSFNGTCLSYIYKSLPVPSGQVSKLRIRPLGVKIRRRETMEQRNAQNREWETAANMGGCHVCNVKIVWRSDSVPPAYRVLRVPQLTTYKLTSWPEQHFPWLNLLL